MKIQEYELKKLGQSAVDFHDDLRDLVNSGKFAHPIVSAVPSWTADNGEMAFYDGTSSSVLSGKRIYVRLSSSWEVFATAPFIGFPNPPEGSVQVYSSGSFGSNSGFLYSVTANHASIGSTASIDESITITTDNYNWDLGRETLNIRDATTSATVGLAGLRVFQGLNPNSNVTSAIGNFGIISDVNIPSSNTSNWVDQGRIFGIASYVRHQGGGTLLRAYGIRSSVTSNSATVLIGIHSKVNTDDPPGNSGSGKTRVGVLIDSFSESTALTPTGLQYGLFVARHALPTNIPGGTGNPTYALFTEGGAQTKTDYLENVCGFTSPVSIGQGVATVGALGSLHLYPDHFIAGSGVVSGSAGSTTVNGSGTIFATEFRGGLSFPSGFPAVPHPGTLIYLIESNKFYVVSTINSQTELILNEPILAAVTSQAFRVLRPAAVFETTVTRPEPDSMDWPDAVVILQDGRMGIGDIQPTERLSVDGNVKVSGNITVSNINVIIGTSTRGVGTFFTTTAIGVASNNASEITLLRGIVGTTSLVANTFSDGRTIRLQARGYYNTAVSAPSLQWRVKLGGTTVLTTGSLQTIASVSTGMFDLTGLITCWTTGGAGTVYAQGGIQMGTAGLDGHYWAMVNSGTIILNTTGANVVEITAQWGSGAFQNEVAMTHCVGELLN